MIFSIKEIKIENNYILSNIPYWNEYNLFTSLA